MTRRSSLAPLEDEADSVVETRPTDHETAALNASLFARNDPDALAAVARSLPVLYEVRGESLSAQGQAVVSVDPLYGMSRAVIERRVEETFDEVMDQKRQNAEEFVWTHVPSVDELGRRRMAAMRRFLADYPRGKAEGRYVEASLPELPFDDGAFDLALSRFSHPCAGGDAAGGRGGQGLSATATRTMLRLRRR